MSTAKAVKLIDALIAYVKDHWRTPDYGDRLEDQFIPLDTAVYVEARCLGLQDSELPRKDPMIDSDEIMSFGRTNVPGAWDKRPDRPATLTMMATADWLWDMLALRALAEVGGVLEPKAKGAKPTLTNEDRYILIVLNAHRGKPLTFQSIERESVRMEQEDRKKVRRLSESMIRQRVPILLTLGFVARPPRTQKKGISITEAGEEALSFAVGNPPETHRKN